MIRIEFPQQLYDELRGHLLGAPDGREDAAYLLCGITRTGTLTKLLVREIHRVPDDLSSKGHAHVTVNPDFISRVVKKARVEGAAVLLTHSHPFSDRSVNFSGIDDAGERDVLPRLQQQIPGVPHGAIVFGQNSLRARVYLPGSTKSIEPVVRVVGPRSQDAQGSGPRDDGDEAFSRQRPYVRGQKRLQDLVVGIVGTGGNGSHLVQQLAMVGVRNFVLIDPDGVETTNLNRLVRSRKANAGDLKVEVAKEVADLYGAGYVRVFQGDVRHLDVAKELLACDVIFGCTDTMSSRVVLNRLVHQHYIPLIDTGVELAAKDGTVNTGVVRVDAVLPSGPCLECRGILGQDKASNYGVEQEHAISVAHLNAMAAAWAVDTFLAMFADAPTRRSLDSIQYRILDGVAKTYSVANVTGCTLCTEVLGQGDAIDLPCIKSPPSMAANTVIEEA